LSPDVRPDREVGAAVTERSEEIHYDTEGQVALITIDRPDCLNALDDPGYRRLWDLLRPFEADPARRVAIVTGAGGRAFSVGSDMRQPFWHPGEGKQMTVTEAFEPAAVRKPVIAAIDGYCVGGGLEWALRCDIRIATPRSSFGLPEPLSGTLAGFGLHMLSRLIPPGEALYMQLTGAPVDAARAYRCCLVQELVAPEDLLTRAREIADMVLACSPLAVEAIKQTVSFGLRQGVGDSYDFVAPLAVIVGASEDAKEGPRAFVEKRPPSWQGR
jgi:enoyl-CoA hydratase/carnithine racemase